MNIRQELEREHSKDVARKLADSILQQQQHFVQLMELLVCGDPKLAQRAAWPVGIIGEEMPTLLYPYLRQLLRCLENPPHDAVSRNIYRSLQTMEIPEEHHAELLDLCLRDLKDPTKPTAVKAFCMTTAFNIAKVYPEIITELQLVIGKNMPHASKGFISRANKILREMQKLGLESEGPARYV